MTKLVDKVCVWRCLLNSLNIVFCFFCANCSNKYKIYQKNRLLIIGSGWRGLRRGRGRREKGLNQSQVFTNKMWTERPVLLLWKSKEKVQKWEMAKRIKSEQRRGGQFWCSLLINAKPQNKYLNIWHKSMGKWHCSIFDLNAVEGCFNDRRDVSRSGADVRLYFLSIIIDIWPWPPTNNWPDYTPLWQSCSS